MHTACPYTEMASDGCGQLINGNFFFHLRLGQIETNERVTPQCKKINAGCERGVV